MTSSLPPVSDPNPPRRPARVQRPAPPPDAPPAAAVPQQQPTAEPEVHQAPPQHPQHPYVPPAGQLAPVVGDGLLDQVQANDATSLLAGLARLRRKRVDPLVDYVPDGNRVPRVVKAAVAHVAALTSRTQQEVYRDAVLGIDPLPVDILDAHYLDLYGREEFERRPWGPNPRDRD